jgi:uncharacterized protein (DUF2062 family)
MKYLRDRIRAVLEIDDPPDRIALAAAIGVFIAFTPTLGLHTISCLLLAWLFRVSKFVALTSSLIMNPWTMVPLYSFCLWLGIKITGSEIAVPVIAWNELTLSGFFSVVRPYLWPLVAGTLSIGTVSAIVSYVVVYRTVLRSRGRA